MENQEQTSFTFEIDNFWEKEKDVISSPIFLSGGCEWYVDVYPKGYCCIDQDHLSLFLCVANPELLRLGWRRRATSSIILLNQSGKELYGKHEHCNLFCAQFYKWGKPRALSLKELKGLLEENKLIVKVEIKVVEVVDEGDITGKEMLDVSGFQVLYSQVVSVSNLFMAHPDIAVNFQPMPPLLKTAFMNILLGVIKTLNKHPHSFTKTELYNAHSELNMLTNVGFKLYWLKIKLVEVYLKWEKENTVGSSRDLGLVKHINNLKAELNKEKFNDWFEGIVHSWSSWLLSILMKK